MKLSYPKGILSAIMVIAYIALSIFGLFMISGHMSHGRPMTNCPYMMEQHSICPMDTFSHMAAWQSMINILIPSMVLIVAIAVFVIGQTIVGHSPPTFFRRRPDRQYSLYVELFSNGILNPKIH